MIFKFISNFKNKIENAELKLKKTEDELKEVKAKATLFVKIVLAMLITIIILNIIILTILIVKFF